MTKRDLNGWIFTLGAFIGLVSTYWCVPHVATLLIAVSSYAGGIIVCCEYNYAKGNKNDKK